MDKRLFSIIDIETTGGNPKSDKIIEIAIVVTDGDRIIKQYSSLVYPERRVMPFITGLTGITNEMLEDAPKFYEIAGEIVEITKDTIFIAHNVSFDWSFLSRAFYTTGVENKMFYAKLDTISFAFAKFFNDKEITKFNLGFLCEHYGIENNNAHTALSDARATYSLYRKMTEQ